MAGLALTLLILAIVCVIAGFFARIFFFLALVLFIIAMFGNFFT